MIGSLKARKSLNGILSSFNKTIDDLAEFRQKNEEDIKQNNQNIADLQVKTKVLVDDSTKAEKIQAKITEFIS